MTSFEVIGPQQIVVRSSGSLASEALAKEWAESAVNWIEARMRVIGDPAPETSAVPRRIVIEGDYLVDMISRMWTGARLAMPDVPRRAGVDRRQRVHVRERTQEHVVMKTKTKRINYRTTSVEDAATLMIERFGVRAGHVALARVPSANNDARRFWAGVERAVGERFDACRRVAAYGRAKAARADVRASVRVSQGAKGRRKP